MRVPFVVYVELLVRLSEVRRSLRLTRRRYLNSERPRSPPMLTLYFSPGVCSMASHIGLEESRRAVREAADAAAERRAQDRGVSQGQPARQGAGARRRRQGDHREHRDPHVPREALSREEPDAERPDRRSALHLDDGVVLEQRAPAVSRTTCGRSASPKAKRRRRR